MKPNQLKMIFAKKSLKCTYSLSIFYWKTGIKIFLKISQNSILITFFMDNKLKTCKCNNAYRMSHANEIVNLLNFCRFF